MCDRNSVSVSETKTDTEFRYRYRSRNLFSRNRNCIILHFSEIAIKIPLYIDCLYFAASCLISICRWWLKRIIFIKIWLAYPQTTKASNTYSSANSSTSTNSNRFVDYPIWTRGADYAHQIILAPLDLQTLLRPWISLFMLKILKKRKV